MDRTMTCEGVGFTPLSIVFVTLRVGLMWEDVLDVDRYSNGSNKQIQNQGINDLFKMVYLNWKAC